MESIVQDNYLSYHAMEKTTSCYSARPLEAFADVEEDNDQIDFSTIFDFDTKSLDPEEKEKIEKAKSLFYDTKLDFGIPELTRLPDY